MSFLPPISPNFYDKIRSPPPFSSVQGLFYAEDHEFQIYRLDDEVGRSQAYGFYSHFDLGIGGHDNEHHIRPRRLHIPQKFQTSHLGHLDVRNDQRKIVFIKVAQSFCSVVGRDAGIPFFSKPLRNDGADHLFIIDNEYPIFQFYFPLSLFRNRTYLLTSPFKNLYNSDWRNLQLLPILIAFIFPRRTCFNRVGFDTFKYWIASSVVKTVSSFIVDIRLPQFVLFFLIFCKLYAR